MEAWCKTLCMKPCPVGYVTTRMNQPASSPFLHHVGASLLQAVLQLRFLPAVLAGAAVVAIQSFAAWQAWHHAREVPWASHAATLLTTLAALWVGFVVVRDQGDPQSGSTSLYRVARGLATGYYFNFLQPLLRSLRQARGHPGNTRHLFSVKLDGQDIEHLPAIHGLIVAIPCHDASICDTPAAGAARIARRCDDLQMHTIVFDQIRHGTDSVWSRPIELRLLCGPTGSPAVLLDVPTTLNVVHRTMSRQPGGDDGRSEVRTATEQFVQVLNEFRDVVAQVGSSDPLRLQSQLQVHVVPAEVAEHRIRELLSSGS